MGIFILKYLYLISLNYKQTILMFSENEIATLIEIPEVLEAVVEARKDFIQNEVSMLEISEHDFLSLIMMTPPVGIARANGSVSLFEELALNKMARKMSKGGFFLKLDPVAHAMKYLIKSYDQWEMSFYGVIKICMECTFNASTIPLHQGQEGEQTLTHFARQLMGVPYAMVRFISSFFLHEESELVEERNISRVEYEKILDIGNKLGIDQYAIFHSFCNTFQVK